MGASVGQDPSQAWHLEAIQYLLNKGIVPNTNKEYLTISLSCPEPSIASYCSQDEIYIPHCVSDHDPV